MTQPARRDRPLAHVVLVAPEIHWNTGNAGRSCLAVGARLHLVEPLGFSLDEREVRRAGLDYWPRVDPRVWPSWDSLESGLLGSREPVLFSAEAEQDFWEAEWTDPPFLVFGCESVGLPVELRRRYERSLVRIPMADAGVRSLNLSTSVAVALFEVARRRRGDSRPRSAERVLAQEDDS